SPIPKATRSRSSSSDPLPLERLVTFDDEVGHEFAQLVRHGDLGSRENDDAPLVATPGRRPPDDALVLVVALGLQPRVGLQELLLAHARSELERLDLDDHSPPTSSRRTCGSRLISRFAIEAEMPAASAS